MTTGPSQTRVPFFFQTMVSGVGSVTAVSGVDVGVLVYEIVA
jgi:hypothetical protein